MSKDWQDIMIENFGSTWGTQLVGVLECGQLCERILKLRSELKECRGHLVNSVAKECKCKNIASINDSFVKHNRELKAELAQKDNVLKEICQYTGSGTVEMMANGILKKYKNNRGISEKYYNKETSRENSGP